jgi:heptosyltransferase II
VKFVSRKPLEIPRDARVLVRAPNWIGDVVIATAALDCLRQALPAARISVLAKPWVIPVLGHNPHIDEIIVYDRAGLHRGPPGLLRLCRYLRGRRFAAAVLLQRAIEAALIAVLARVPIRLGYSTDARGWLLTHKAKAASEEFLIPRLEHDLKLLEGFGMKPGRKELVLRLGPEQKKRAWEILGGFGVGPGDRLFALSPGSVGGAQARGKRWHPERFAALAAKLAAAHGARGILLGASHEKELGEEIVRLASVPGLVNLAGSTSLDEAIALTGFCGLFVTNDSGLMHVAAALDVPLVAVFGPTDPRKTAPWSKRAALVRNEELECCGCKPEKCGFDHACMSGISVDQVFEAAGRLVEKEGFDPTGRRAERIPTAERAVPVITAAMQQEARPQDA